MLFEPNAANINRWSDDNKDGYTLSNGQVTNIENINILDKDIIYELGRMEQGGMNILSYT
jgi:hypothetical protein